MRDRVLHPRQVLFIDESAKDANAARRRRAWSPFGITPIVDAPMVREFDKRYTLIAACNWEGFVQEACHIVEREHGKDDPNPDRGTVDTGRFEQYLEDFVVPVLGELSYRNPIQLWSWTMPLFTTQIEFDLLLRMLELYRSTLLPILQS